MATKTNRTKTRVCVNTGLFIIAAILFVIVAFCGTQRIGVYQRSMVGISDAPGLCFDSEAYEKNNHEVIQDAYPCKTEIDENGENIPADSQNDQTMFLYDRMSLVGSLTSIEIQAAIMTIGCLLSMASFIGGIIYWNHNRK